MPRRRWIVVGALALVGVFLAFRLLQEPTYEAVAWLRIRANGGLVGNGGNQEEYAAFRRTQFQLLRSPIVINAALRQPGISSLVTVTEKDDPVDWLAKSVEVVTNDQSEVVQITLKGTRPDDLRQILDAVTKTYIDDIVSKERDDRTARRELLQKKYEENMGELRARREAIAAEAPAPEITDGIDAASRKELLLGEIAALRQQRTSVLVESRSLRADIEEAERLGSPADPRRTARLAILETQAETLTAEMDGIVRTLSDRAKARAEFEARVADLAALERVTDQIGLQLESTALDLSAPPRVTLLEEATVGVKW